MFFWEMWYLDLSGSGESKSIVLDQSYVSEFKYKHDEFLTLDSISEKLEFYDDNRHLFEFPYNEFIVRDYFNIQYTFSFKPAPHFLEIHIYNPWFIERSIEYLSHMSYITTGIPFHSCEQLWENFIETKDSLPLLKKFIKREKKRLKALCEVHAPGRFEYWYEYKIIDAKVLGPRHELTKDYWKELFVKELVDYIIKLEKYNQEDKNSISAVEPQTAKIQRSFTTSSEEFNAKTNSTVNNDLTFLQLFRNNQENVDKFISILIKHEYLTPEAKWNYELYKPGYLIPIIDHIENEGIIKNIGNKTQISRIFNLQLNMDMSSRNYSKTKKTITIDLNLLKDLEGLKR
ncbi:hypothetical protein ACFSKU_19145 [Pontibacter silvestris]|uniref:Uncharacterized protein n=1 Tax=Pontibacter silvestris TaxID=2305183 RepID=A0ABW4X3C2_9BACT|nr:hypothetical protein [Pontibacter silvestris]MCC9134992.1 hypothetical protein [Pontibacter silvestris]